MLPADLLAVMDRDRLISLMADVAKAAPLTPNDYRQKFDDLQVEVDQRINDLAGQVASGKLGVLAFRDRVFRILRRAFADAYRWGLGASGNQPVLYDVDLSTIRSYLAEDDRYLIGFIRDIRSGDVPGTPQAGDNPEGHFDIADRAQMYANALRAMFFKGLVARIEQPTQLIDWVLGNTEHCGPCVGMADGSPYTIVTLAGRVPGADVCDGLDRCGCSLVTR